MQSLLAWAREAWPYLFTIAYVAGAAWVTVDAVLRKRHAPSVVGWVGLAWLAPISGAVATRYAAATIDSGRLGAILSRSRQS